MKYLPLVSLLLTGCLTTRADLREAQDPTPQRKTVQQQQQARAPQPPPPPPPVTTASRFEEYDEQIRNLNGRLEVVENGVAQVNARRQNEDAGIAKDKQAQDQRLLAYEDALKKLEAQVLALGEEVTKLKTPPPAPVAPAKPGRGAYDEGEQLLAAKKYKEAIVAYQKYRDENPKGKVYADATYKIGVAFHEIGMKDESRAFYEEVIAKFPKSAEAKKAQARLKSGK